jgi:RHS repeat-associated protein
VQEETNFGFVRADPMKFTGHERDFQGVTNVDNGDYVDYMHARFYSPNWARFLSVDPGPVDARDPQSWNRYSYVVDNPLNYTDPTGEVVDLAVLSPEDRNDLLISLNNTSGNEYGTNNEGELTLISAGQNASTTATKFINDVIASTNVYTVTPVNSSPVNLMNSYLATGAINIDFADFKNTKTSGLSVEAMGLGSNLIHELVHVHMRWDDPPRAGTPGVPASEDAKHVTGPAVDFVNRIHSERGLPLRGPSYAPANTDPSIGGRIRVPFISPETGRTVYVLPKLRQ